MDDFTYKYFTVDGVTGFIAYDALGRRRIQANLPGNFRDPDEIKEVPPAVVESKPVISVHKMAEEMGLLTNNDADEIASAINQTIEENPKAVVDYLNGKTAAIGVLIGLAKKKCRADAKTVKISLENKISELANKKMI